MKVLTSLVIAAMLSATAPACAERLDLGTYRCKAFLSTPKDKVEQILMWLDAYFSEEGTSPVIDFEKVKLNGAKIAEYCTKNPGASVVVAADAVLGK